jgi:hypothetical protein
MGELPFLGCAEPGRCGRIGGKCVGVPTAGTSPHVKLKAARSSESLTTGISRIPIQLRKRVGSNLQYADRRAVIRLLVGQGYSLVPRERQRWRTPLWTSFPLSCLLLSCSVVWPSSSCLFSGSTLETRRRSAKRRTPNGCGRWNWAFLYPMLRSLGLSRSGGSGLGSHWPACLQRWSRRPSS